MADWTSLPNDLLHNIVNRLPIEDFLVFDGVCREFRDAKGKEGRSPVNAKQQPPWLLLCPQDDETKKRGFLTLSGRKFFVDLPELNVKHCWGTLYGWILTLNTENQFHLFNPFNRQRILLPKLSIEEDTRIYHKERENRYCWVRWRYIHRAVLIRRSSLDHLSSSSSNSNDFLLLAIAKLSGVLRVARTHIDNSWVEMEFPPSPYINGVKDVAYYKGHVYAVGWDARVVICTNLDGPGPPIAEDYVSPVNNEDCKMLYGGVENLYLVESQGDLLLLVRSFDHIDSEPGGRLGPLYGTVDFEVYKLDHKARQWVEIRDLGNCALFVGECQTISLSDPERMNCRSNCIYFMDDSFDFFQDGRDMGIFDMKDDTVTAIEGVGRVSINSSPTWFIPSL